MSQLGGIYGTGEMAPADGVYQIVGHEFPAAAACTSGDWHATMEVAEGSPLPSHARCGRGALWRLVSVVTSREQIAS